MQFQSLQNEHFQNIDYEILGQNSSDLSSKLGLSPNQSKVFLCLLQTGTKTASQLSRTLGIPRTEIYALIGKLKEKGCITLKNGRPSKFRAVSIEKFIEKKIELEKKKIQKLEETKLVIQQIKLSNNSEHLFF